MTPWTANGILLLLEVRVCSFNGFDKPLKHMGAHSKPAHKDKVSQCGANI